MKRNFFMERRKTLYVPELFNFPFLLNVEKYFVFGSFFISLFVERTKLALRTGLF